MLTMKSLSDHLAPATQRNITVLQRLLIHLEERKSLLFTIIVTFCQYANNYAVHL